MSWLLVTPARNEAHNLPAVATRLAEQSRRDLIGLWVIVDDGSTDGTATAFDWRSLPFRVEVLRRDEPAKGLRGGGAFDAFYAGAHRGLALLPGATRVLKFDADMAPAPDYLEELANADRGQGLIGGVITSRREREQLHHVRGALKAYSREAFAIVATLPAAVGLDVMDEVALRAAGLEVEAVPAAQVEVLRRTGSSEGTLKGRMRGGMVTRTTGYHPAYVALRLARYAVRRPYVLGSAAMALGWITAPASPYSAELLRAHRSQQKERIRRLVTHPVSYLREAFA